MPNIISDDDTNNFEDIDNASNIVSHTSNFDDTSNSDKTNLTNIHLIGF